MRIRVTRKQGVWRLFKWAKCSRQVSAACVIQFDSNRSVLELNIVYQVDSVQRLSDAYQVSIMVLCHNYGAHDLLRDVGS